MMTDSSSPTFPLSPSITEKSVSSTFTLATTCWSRKSKLRCVNFFAGPGTGKSTAATGLFSEIKRRGVNAEYIPEFAKDAAWENRGKKFFAAQQFIYGEQSWRFDRVKDDVDIMITDSPLIMANVYMHASFPMPSLRDCMMQDFNRYDNLNIFLRRSKKFNPSGRKQDEAQSIQLDAEIKAFLVSKEIEFTELDTGLLNAYLVIDLMIGKGWAKPDTGCPALNNIPTQEQLLALQNFYY